MDTGYPRPLSVWRIPGNQVGAVTQWTNSRTYFFTTDGQYYRFNDGTFNVDAGYPRSVATLWQGCSTQLQEETDDGEGAAGALVPILAAVVMSLVLGLLHF